MTNRFTHLLHEDTDISNLGELIDRFKTVVRPAGGRFEDFTVFVNGERLDALDIDVSNGVVNFRSRP